MERRRGKLKGIQTAETIKRALGGANMETGNRAMSPPPPLLRTLLRTSSSTRAVCELEWASSSTFVELALIYGWMRGEHGK